MKQNKIGIIIGIISIAAFLTLLIATIVFANKVLEDEKQKTAYYADLYGLTEELDETNNVPIKFPSQEYLIDQGSKGYNAIKELRVLHSQSDYFLMGGRLDHYTSDADELWSKIIESAFLQQSEYESIRDNLLDEADFTKDMNNMISLLNIATKQRSLDALRYMHRILHDIDLYGFTAQGVTPTGYWGATHTVPSSNNSQLNEITAFIEKHTL
ncbi:MAG: hypothetical protein NAG76_12725 [Candidatus Pristimantibacillus lignocellulolyticus]|uniref:Uncharacterized protein n=1 Tax=Candidatus Pristimantibacillus lignocellulolyticus TaxID=2994561 RepID=A0A9J6Z925_9BACL|nr:MAG: hypothetical protein NAG76_12725 [Candidatus Pristimantibacillus lignocellulolyticus]